MEFEGVKRDDDGVYYYDDDVVQRSSVPLSDNVEGDVPVDRGRLEELFGLTESSLPELPRFLVSPHLNSAWGGTYENEPETSWYNVSGNVVVYKPVEWVASVTQVKEWPAGEDSGSPPEESEVEGPALRLYDPAEFALEIPDEEGSLRARPRIKEEVVLGGDSGGLGDLERTMADDIDGDAGAIEVVLGIMLRVTEVYVHNIPELWLDDRHQGESLNWREGPSWDDIHLPCPELANVGGTKFSSIKMIGEGHSDSLWLTALPVVDGDDVTDLHVALSCEGWEDWYAYVVGDKGPADADKLTAYPQFRPRLAVIPSDL